MKTQYLNSLQVQGLCRLGDVIIPGDERLPKFSATCFVFSADKMLKYLPHDDLAGLKFLLFLFAFTPKILITILLQIIEKRDLFPAPLALPLKMLNVGLKGVVFTLYYSKLDDMQNWGNKIMETLNYETKIIPPPELKNNSAHLDERMIFAYAKKAEVDIRRLSLKDRLSYVERVKAVILNSFDPIIDQIQKETKKSRTDALVSEIFSVIDYCDFLIRESKNALSDKKVKTPLMLMGKKSLMYFEPLGTVLVISPWNYPFFQAIVPLMTSFICGNANIYKPSEYTPLTGLVEKILSSAGFVNNWIQIVYGEGKIGSNLISQRPDKIFFTGSVATGKKIMEQAAKLLIPVELELGGKDAAIVFEDANLERTTSGVLWGALTNLGQSCTSVERIYVQDKIFEPFKKLLIEKTQELIQSVDQDGNSDIGHMTTEQQCLIIKNQLDDALNKGAVLHTGKNWDGKSLNIPPMVLSNIKANMKIYQEESFGPFLPLISFSQEEEVVQDANNSTYGLSASVWSKDLERCQKVARKLKVGNVSINNVMLTEGNPYLPFGGVKDSGIGRYKGVVGFQTFCNIKSVLIDKNSSKIEANWFPYTLKKYKYFETLTKTAFKKDPWSFIVFALTGIQLESHAQKTKRAK